MFSLLKKLKSHYKPLNQIHLNKERLIENFTILNRRVGINIVPVLKSNAYGHGLVLIGKEIDKLEPPFICVDSLPEANILKKAGIKSEILIMGAIAKETLKDQKIPFQLTILSKDALNNVLYYHPKSKVHLFIDTGMHREGITIDELSEVLNILEKSSLKLSGVMTHLAIADDRQNPLTKKQIDLFKKAKKIILEKGFTPEYFHFGGSDSIEFVEADLVNTVRTGRLLYGISSANLKILPVLELTSTIVQIKQLKKGESVGYDGMYKAQKDMAIAILPIGYNDGVDRRLSNKGIVQVKGIECPILGLVSMNITTIDISKVKNPKIGDTAIIYSKNPKDKNSIENTGKLINTNPSSILVGLHASTRREVI